MKRLDDAVDHRAVTAVGTRSPRRAAERYAFFADSAPLSRCLPFRSNTPNDPVLAAVDVLALTATEPALPKRRNVLSARNAKADFYSGSSDRGFTRPLLDTARPG